MFKNKQEVLLTAALCWRLQRLRDSSGCSRRWHIDLSGTLLAASGSQTIYQDTEEEPQLLNFKHKENSRLVTKQDFWVCLTSSEWRSNYLCLLEYVFGK